MQGRLAEVGQEVEGEEAEVEEADVGVGGEEVLLGLLEMRTQLLRRGGRRLGRVVGRTTIVGISGLRRWREAGSLVEVV